MALDTKKFMTRTASAAVFVVLLLGCVSWHYISFILFFTVVGLVGHYEFYKLAETQNKKAVRPVGYVLHLLIIASLPVFYNYVTPQTFNYLCVFAMVAPLFLLAELFRSKTSIFQVPPVVMATLYVTIPCFLLCLMAVKCFVLNEEYIIRFQPHAVLAMIFFIWINDTGAYLVGSLIGKHKMFPSVSPGKTWEGTIGGVILCIAFSFVMVKLFVGMELIPMILMSAIIAVFATLGDLVQSKMKRIAGVKDSGNIMPGHGGVLDRFDSLLFVTPFVFVTMIPLIWFR